MSFSLTTLRRFYKVSNVPIYNINKIFRDVKSSYKPGDYLNFYNDKMNNMFDIAYNEYHSYRIHLSVLEKGEVEKSNLPRQLCLLEGKLFIDDSFSNLNLTNGCYSAKTPHYIENKSEDTCVVISHVDIRDNLKDLPLL